MSRPVVITHAAKKAVAELEEQAALAHERATTARKASKYEEGAWYESKAHAIESIIAGLVYDFEDVERECFLMLGEPGAYNSIKAATTPQAA